MYGEVLLPKDKKYYVAGLFHEFYETFTVVVNTIVADEGNGKLWTNLKSRDSWLF